MEICVSEAKTHLSNLIQQLIDGKEDIIYISKNGKLVAQLTLVKNKKYERLGTARKEMQGFDLSLEDFNNIPIDCFES